MRYFVPSLIAALLVGAPSTHATEAPGVAVACVTFGTEENCFSIKREKPLNFAAPSGLYCKVEVAESGNGAIAVCISDQGKHVFGTAVDCDDYHHRNARLIVASPGDKELIVVSLVCAGQMI
jgi:hypothetical protein